MKLPLHLGIHCHQLVENFYHVVDYAVEKSYLPYFETALLNDKFKFSIHYSGWLLEYIKKNHTKLFSLMGDAVQSGQAEFFTGGYYEPVLASIPSLDRREQIKMLNGFIEDNFQVSPKGLWLTERVWDSSIIPDCAECGVEYVIVDDYHFVAAGFYESMLHGHFKTEQDGCEMLIFPISEKLRYLTPFKPAKDVVGYLEEVADSGGKSLTIFDDGEKFGLWPETYEWVYEKGWLKDFIDAVVDSEKCEFALFKDTVKEQKPAQIAYLPTVSYFEMGEWSLFSERTEKMEELIKELEETHDDDTTKVFVKGGIWKNFLVKYPESNRIHKRTVALSKRANKSGDKALLESLYKAQCNDVLWHGIFGGLYLPNLRNNAYRFIIEAEKRLEKVEKLSLPMVEVGDFDFDGYDEAYLRSDTANYMFVSRDCGQLVSLEDKDNLFNFANTLARRKEAYHDKLFAEPEKSETGADEEAVATIHDSKNKVDESYKKFLVFDWHNKNSFIDHFVPSFEPEDFEDVTFKEIGDFANQPAEMKTDKGSVTFNRVGGIYSDGIKHPVSIVKNFTAEKDGLTFQIDIDTDVQDVTYVMELNLHFNDMKNVLINGKPIADNEKSLNKLYDIKDKNTPKGVKIKFEEECSLHTYTVKTLSQSESGADLTDQGICLLIPFTVTGSKSIKGKLTIG